MVLLKQRMEGKNIESCKIKLATTNKKVEISIELFVPLAKHAHWA